MPYCFNYCSLIVCFEVMKYEASNFVFLSQEDSDILVYLLNGNGIEILKNNSNYDIFLNSILTSGKKYVDKLFDNKDFTNLVLENINNSKVKFYYLNQKLILEIMV